MYLTPYQCYVNKQPSPKPILTTVITDTTDLTKAVSINIGVLKEQVALISNTQTKNKIKVTLTCVKDKTLVSTGLKAGDADLAEVEVGCGGHQVIGLASSVEFTLFTADATQTASLAFEVYNMSEMFKGLLIVCLVFISALY